MSSDNEERPPPPKRRRIKPVIISNSSDESEGSVLRTLRHRVVHKRSSGAEAAGTSCAGETTGKSEKPSSSASGTAEHESVEPKRRLKSSKAAKSPKKSKEEVATSSKVGADSDGSDGQGEQCPICLIVFVNQEVASPSSCDHFFCFQCLMEWSKNTNTCPVDRKTFNVMDVRPKYGDKVERHIPVAVRPNIEHPAFPGLDDEDDTDIELDFFGNPGGVIMAGILRIAFPRRNSFSSDSSDLGPINTDTDEPSSPSNSRRSSSPALSSEGASPLSFVNITSTSENEPSSPAENQEHSSPSENRQLSSSPEVQQYSSMEESSSVNRNEHSSSPSVKTENSSDSERERNLSSPSVDEYVFSSEKEESPANSEDEKTTDPPSDDDKTPSYDENTSEPRSEEDNKSSEPPSDDDRFTERSSDDEKSPDYDHSSSSSY